ncbi:hypothetical protein B566_EDAN008524, partial [Ephemera danica]
MEDVPRKLVLRPAPEAPMMSWICCMRPDGPPPPSRICTSMIRSSSSRNMRLFMMSSTLLRLSISRTSCNTVTHETGLGVRQLTASMSAGRILAFSSASSSASPATPLVRGSLMGSDTLVSAILASAAAASLLSTANK